MWRSRDANGRGSDNECHQIKCLAYITFAAHHLTRYQKVALDPTKAGMSRDDIVLALRNGTPSIEVLPSGTDTIYINPMTLVDGEEQVVLDRLLAILNKQSI